MYGWMWLITFITGSTAPVDEKDEKTEDENQTLTAVRHPKAFGDELVGFTAGVYSGKVGASSS